MRLPLTILLGLAFALALFWLLWNMLSGPVGTGKSVEATRINFTLMERDTQVQTKVRQKPKRLPPPKVPRVQKMKVTSHDNTQRTHLPQLTPQLGLGNGSGNALGIGGLVGPIESTDPVPLVRIPPQYPRRALLAHKEGYVIVAFTITKSGSVKNLSIMEAKPRGFFEQAAINAVRQWRFKPQSVERRAHNKIEFKLPGGQGG